MEKEIKTLSDLMRTMQDNFTSIHEYQEKNEEYEYEWYEHEFYDDGIVWDMAKDSYMSEHDMSEKEFDAMIENGDCDDFYDFENEYIMDLKGSAYQVFIVSERDAKQLNNYSEIVTYDSEENIYLWQKYHYGMPFNHIRVTKNPYFKK